MAERHCAFLILWENKNTFKMFKNARRSVTCRKSWIFSTFAATQRVLPLIEYGIKRLPYKENLRCAAMILFSANLALEMLIRLSVIISECSSNLSNAWIETFGKRNFLTNSGKKTSLKGDLEGECNRKN